jgi:hypothetical protein
VAKVVMWLKCVWYAGGRVPNACAVCALLGPGLLETTVCNHMRSVTLHFCTFACLLRILLTVTNSTFDNAACNDGQLLLQHLDLPLTRHWHGVTGSSLTICLLLLPLPLPVVAAVRPQCSATARAWAT